jgi:hypothetical protein
VPAGVHHHAPHHRTQRDLVSGRMAPCVTLSTSLQLDEHPGASRTPPRCLASLHAATTDRRPHTEISMHAHTDAKAAHRSPTNPGEGVLPNWFLATAHTHT